MIENSPDLHAADQQHERMWLKKTVQILLTIHSRVTAFSVFALLMYL